MIIPPPLPRSVQYAPFPFPTPAHMCCECSKGGGDGGAGTHSALTGKKANKGSLVSPSPLLCGVNYSRSGRIAAKKNRPRPHYYTHGLFPNFRNVEGDNYLHATLCEVEGALSLQGCWLGCWRIALQRRTLGAICGIARILRTVATPYAGLPCGPLVVGCPPPLFPLFAPFLLRRERRVALGRA